MWTEKTKSWTINITISAIVGVLLLPIQMFTPLIGRIIMQSQYHSLHNYFDFDWVAFNSRIIDVRRFFEFWFVGFGIYLIHLIFYFISFFIIVGLSCKINNRSINKLRMRIVAMLLIATIAHIGGIRRPNMNTFAFADVGYRASNAFLFAFIMFSLFALAGFLLNKHTKINEFVKVVLSLIVSVVLGFLLSGVVWLILFNIFN